MEFEVYSTEKYIQMWIDIKKLMGSIFGLSCMYLLYRLWKSKRQVLVHMIYSDDKRLSNACPTCGVDSHSFRTCDKFKVLKDATNRQVYVDNSLDGKDEIGFTAANILPFHQVDNSSDKLLFFIEEKRGDITAFGIVGGKRESRMVNGIFRYETSLQTALAEFEEEVKPRLSKTDFDMFRMEISSSLNKGHYKVMWIPISKAVVYLVSVSHVPTNYPCTNPLLPFRWLSLEDKWAWQRNIHEFILPWLEILAKNPKFWT
jgi:hypothetical protein